MYCRRTAVRTYQSVSYTHLDVYKRQQDGRESQILLSGDDWKFAWYPSVEEVPEHFWEKDLEKEGFINMEVPDVYKRQVCRPVGTTTHSTYTLTVIVIAFFRFAVGFRLILPCLITTIL